jgi:UDP-N-acetylglucosamine 2-epimerase (non-hydrolysing)
MHQAFSNRADHCIIHTGQHYDPMMSDIFFSDLDIPHPEVNLSVGSGSHASQTASMIAALEPELERLDPTWIVVYGDTNSTIAASLVGAKMGLRVAHLEAGPRSFNRAVPEEVNRVLTDHASDLCLAPSATAMDNLEREGLLDRSVMVGDVMVDVLYDTLNKLGISLDKSERPKGQYLVASIHRQENTEEEQILRAVLATLDTMPLPVRLFTHPRLRERIGRFSIDTEVSECRIP